MSTSPARQTAPLPRLSSRTPGYGGRSSRHDRPAPEPARPRRRRGTPRPLAVEQARAPARSHGNRTARPIPGRRQPRRAERKVEGAARPPGAAEGRSAGLGRRSSAVSTETPVRAALATQRGPAGGRKILGGRGRNGAGPGGGGDPGGRRINQGTCTRSSPLPHARRRLPVPRLTATARRGAAAPRRGWLGAGFSSRGSTPGGGGRAAPHLRSAEGARGRARTWRRRAWARVPRWGAGSGRRPSRTGCHYFARGGSGQAARAGPPGSTRRAAPLREQGPPRLPSPPSVCHFLLGRRGWETPPRTSVSRSSGHRRGGEGELPAPRRA